MTSSCPPPGCLGTIAFAWNKFEENEHTETKFRQQQKRYRKQIENVNEKNEKMKIENENHREKSIFLANKGYLYRMIARVFCDSTFLYSVGDQKQPLILLTERRRLMYSSFHNTDICPTPVSNLGYSCVRPMVTSSNRHVVLTNTPAHHGRDAPPLFFCV